MDSQIYMVKRRPPIPIPPLPATTTLSRHHLSTNSSLDHRIQGATNRPWSLKNSVKAQSAEKAFESREEGGGGDFERCTENDSGYGLKMSFGNCKSTDGMRRSLKGLAAPENSRDFVQSGSLNGSTKNANLLGELEGGTGQQTSISERSIEKVS